MTQPFQPLDMTINAVTKAFKKRKFTKCYSHYISAQHHGLDQVNHQVLLSAQY